MVPHSYSVGSHSSDLRLDMDTDDVIPYPDVMRLANWCISIANLVLILRAQHALMGVHHDVSSDLMIL